MQANDGFDGFDWDDDDDWDAPTIMASHTNECGHVNALLDNDGLASVFAFYYADASYLQEQFADPAQACERAREIAADMLLLG